MCPSSPGRNPAGGGGAVVGDIIALLVGPGLVRPADADARAGGPTRVIW
jgi:hypothetical protein